MNMPPSRRAQAGFTLIEVLVALSLMALVSLMAWRGLDQVARTRDWITSQAQDTDAIARSLGQLARDIELSYNGPAFEATPRDSQALRTGIRLLRGAASEPMLEILRASPEGDGRWQRVHWRVDARGLWRASGTAAERSPLPEPDNGVLLLADVTKLQVHAWIAGKGWVDTRNALPGPPSGLEVVVERSFHNVPQRFSRVLVLE